MFLPPTKFEIVGYWLVAVLFGLALAVGVGEYLIELGVNA